MSEPKIVIAGREISRNQTPYVIAELSANHNGKLETALKIIEEAAKAGADAVKLGSLQQVLQTPKAHRTVAAIGRAHHETNPRGGSP